MITSIRASLEQAWSVPVVRGIVLVLAAVLLLAPLAYELLRRSGKGSPELVKELYRRHFSWLILAPLMVGPILAGRMWTAGAYLVIALLCCREFARATGFFRHRALSLVVVASIALLFLAAADHWYGFFVALPSLSLATVVVVALLSDRPTGYIQRIGLAALAILLFGVCLGHFAYLANDRAFQPLMLTVLVCVELNDVFAFCCGKTLGKHKLCPGTSPGKTVEGAVGAALLTTLLFATLTSFIYTTGPMAELHYRLMLGGLLSLVGQCGDLVMSSVKRDLGTKDFSAALPGHGGFLDRFDSLIFVGPVVFHYIGYLQGIGLDQPTRIFTGG